MDSIKKIDRLKRAVNEKSMKVIDTSVTESKLTYIVLGNRGVCYDVVFECGKDTKCKCIDQCKTKSFCKHIYLIYVKIFNNIPSGDSLSVTPEIFETLTGYHSAFINRVPLDIKVRNESDDCSICFDPVDTQLGIYCCRVCKNGFHSECIHQMLKFSNRCPLCRTDINFNPDPEETDAIINLTRQIKNM
jgi:hypothetical protein